MIYFIFIIGYLELLYHKQRCGRIIIGSLNITEYQLCIERHYIYAFCH